MKKKKIIIVISSFTALLILICAILAVLLKGLSPKDPTAYYTGVLLQQTEQQEKEPQETKKEEKKESLEVTKIYEFNNEFKASDYKQGIFRDTKSSITLPYCVIEPRNYSANKKYPVILYLHGAGETGTDNVSQVLTMQDAFLVNGDLLSETIIICPQTTSWWSTGASGTGPVAAAVRLIESLSETYNMDKNRIYVMGISMGGYGTWDALSNYPDFFAAGIPICGGGSQSYADVLKDIPIWIYHGTADSTVPFSASESMYNAITALGGNKIHFTRLEGVNHNCWTTALADRELFSWLFSQNKETNPSGNYKNATVFKFLDQNGNTILDDSYAEEPFFHYYNEYVLARFHLTDKGLGILKNAYKEGKELTLIHGNQKLFSFKGTDIEPSNLFEVDTKHIK